MRKIFSDERIILIVLIVVFITIRSIHFTSHLNFSTDQASSSIHVFNIWNQKKLTLIGPSISFHYIGRDLYTGSLTYYIQLIFLLLSRFDPVISSYIFMLCAGIMLIPLYYGTKMLIHQKAALLIAIIYRLLPFYIDFTRFLWNPNFQLSLTPLVILSMGMFKKQQKARYFSSRRFYQARCFYSIINFF